MVAGESEGGRPGAEASVGTISGLADAHRKRVTCVEARDTRFLKKRMYIYI